VFCIFTINIITSAVKLKIFFLKIHAFSLLLPTSTFPLAHYLEKFPDYRRKFIALEGQRRIAPNLFGEETTIIPVGLFPIPRSLSRNFKKQ